MRSCRHRWAIALLGTMLAGFSAGGDLLRPTNTATSDIGAIVDGVRGGQSVNDERYLQLPAGGFFTALFPVVPLADFISGPGEVIAFARRRPPLLVPDVPWTAGSNSIDVDFDDEYLIDVHVWIVDPTPSLPADVADAAVTVSQIWAKERQGIAFASYQIHDATGDPDAGQFLNFNCGMTGSIEASIGNVAGAVNVYYVGTVDFGSGPGTGSGVWCGQDLIGMGRTTSDHLLAHELGHAFSLSHTNANTVDFDNTNVMHNASSVRQYLTEGQTFRSIYNPSSRINATYDVRAGEPTRACSHHYVETNLLCPPVQKRLWADSELWPAN